MDESKSIPDVAAALLARFKPYSGQCDEPGHGPYSGVARPGAPVSCPMCRESLEERERLKEEALQTHQRRERALDKARIVGRYREATFGTFSAGLPKQRAVLQACRDFADRFSSDQGAGLWLLGPAGVGKTHLGCAIAQAVMFQRHLTVTVATAREIIRAIRDNWGHGSRRDSGGTETDTINRFGNVNLLVLDEVGVGFGSESELTQLFDVIDLRYQLRRPTVLLSNLNMLQLKATLGDRLFDRLREGATVLACNWSSHRVKGPFIAGSEEVS